MKAKKLCICGRSDSLPFCDNSHESEHWSCKLEEGIGDLGFASSVRYRNLALKLAAHFNGTTIGPEDKAQKFRTMVLILDGLDLETALESFSNAVSTEKILVTLSVSPEILENKFPGFQIFDCREYNVFQAFRRISEFLKNPKQLNERKPSRLASCFLSHAVVDEPTLVPAVEYLREFFGLDVFLCGDSISPGENWQATISLALRDKEIFVVLLSSAVLESHFCAFEMGYASALKKRMLLISLDGSMPPAFLQHRQCIDLPRLTRQRPWLEVRDLLVESLLSGLSVEGVRVSADI